MHEAHGRDTALTGTKGEADSYYDRSGSETYIRRDHLGANVLHVAVCMDVCDEKGRKRKEKESTMMKGKRKETKTEKKREHDCFLPAPSET